MSSPIIKLPQVPNNLDPELRDYLLNINKILIKKQNEEFADVQKTGEIVSSIDSRVGQIETELSNFRPAKLFQVQHKLPGSTGSGTFTAGAWRDRPLNHVECNEISGASLNTTTFAITLPAGKYEVEGLSMAFYVQNNTARLYNLTKDEVIIIGTAGLSNPNSGYNNTGSEIYGRFELTEETEIQLQHWCSSTRSADGFGYRNVACIDDTDAIYADFRFWKIG